VAVQYRVAVQSDDGGALSGCALHRLLQAALYALSWCGKRLPISFSSSFVCAALGPDWNT
jgi:hypothetical protein